MKTLSAFDIIGPRMMGPSSSHTAGAARLAKIAVRIGGPEVHSVVFTLYGSFAQTYKGHGTDKALVAGILELATDDPRVADAVADAVSLSPNYLSSLFRKQLHCTFREQLCRIRVEESKSLLLNTEYSLADIALAMGFADQSYYCKSFKRIVGIPPGRFRQSV